MIIFSKCGDFIIAFKCGDMPFNFGLARNLQPGFGPDDVREEVLMTLSENLRARQTFSFEGVLLDLWDAN